MSREIYKYVFDSSIDITDVEASLLLALLAAESLHGESQVRLEAAHALDTESRACVIDATGDVGRDLNRLFVGFIRREFGEDDFQVERVERQPNHKPEEVAA
ncbi:MAG: hypothetical protein ACC628_13815 [Pirellulaceae bacterium]